MRYANVFQMKMSQEAVRILTMEPMLRTKEEIHYVRILLVSSVTF